MALIKVLSVNKVLLKRSNKGIHLAHFLESSKNP